MKNYLKPLIGGLLLFGASNIDSNYLIFSKNKFPKKLSFYDQHFSKSKKESNKIYVKINNTDRLLRGYFKQRKGIIQDKFARIQYYIDRYVAAEKARNYLTKGSNGISGFNKIYGRRWEYLSIFERDEKEFEQFGYNLKQITDLFSSHAFVESEGNTRAFSNKKAVGLRQLLDYVAQEQGLRVDDYINESYCPVKSTDAAEKYILGFAKEFNSIEYAFLAYVYSPSKVRKLAKKKNFWEIEKYELPKEAYDYWPKICALMEILEHKKKYGLQIAPEFTSFTSYKIKKKETIETIAKRFDLSVDEIMRNNILRDKNKIPANFEFKIPIKS